MTDLVQDPKGVFENGSPGFAFNNVYRCFPQNGNGLLFRLVNEKKQWAFYNDTENMVFRVTAKLGKASKVKTLGRAQLTEESGEDEEWKYTVSVMVDPGRTERFLEGDVEGFQMDFLSEVMPVEHVEFENGRPSVKYDNVYKCLKDHGNGLLFRLVSTDKTTGERTWSYYNDTKDFLMEVTVQLSDKTCVRPLGRTKVENSPEDDEGVVFKLSVEPLRTEACLCGDPRAYSQSFVANPIKNKLSLDCSEVHFENGKPDPKVIAYPCSKLLKGFKDKGNGLVFVLIDEKEEKWAVYNDTTDYNITVKIAFAPESVYEAAEKTTVSRDPSVKGGTVCSITVPPLATELFITHGNPTEYQMSVVADGVSRSVPEENPSYEHRGPDKRIMTNIDKVYKCFKDHGNGLLFRLVDDERGQWAFYNDTKDATFTVKVNFDHDSTVRMLGKTRREEDADMGPVYVLDVPPLSTELFVKGDLSGFTTKFSGKRQQVA